MTATTTCEWIKIFSKRKYRKSGINWNEFDYNLCHIPNHSENVNWTVLGEKKYFITMMIYNDNFSVELNTSLRKAIVKISICKLPSRINCTFMYLLPCVENCHLKFIDNIFSYSRPIFSYQLNVIVVDGNTQNTSLWLCFY